MSSTAPSPRPSDGICPLRIIHVIVDPNEGDAFLEHLSHALQDSAAPVPIERVTRFGDAAHAYLSIGEALMVVVAISALARYGLVPNGHVIWSVPLAVSLLLILVTRTASAAR